MKRDGEPENQSYSEAEATQETQEFPPLAARVSTLPEAVQLSLKDGLKENTLFIFARAIKALEVTSNRRLSATERDEAFALWWQIAKPLLPSDAEFDEYRFTFNDAFAKARTPLGANQLEEAIRRARLNAVPTQAERYQSPKVRFLAGVCYQLQVLSCGEPFFLSTRDAMRIVGCKHPHQGLTMLRGLVYDGILDLVERGTPGGNDTMLAHAWQEAMAKLLTTEPKDEDLAVLVANEIVKSAASDKFSYSADHYITPTLKILFDQYFESTWPVMGAALLSDDWMTTNHLTNVLGDLHDKNVGASLIASFPIEFLRTWCDQNRPNAAHILARITPVLVKTESSMQWHPVAKMLLDNFGEDEEMLSELSANWGTFSWSGSLIPYYEQQLALIQQLADHALPAVRKWQSQNAEWLQQRIAVERKREEEERLGIR